MDKLNFVNLAKLNPQESESIRELWRNELKAEETDRV